MCYLLMWMILLIFQAYITLLYSVLMSAIIFTQDTDSQTKSLIFFISVLLLCNCCSICFCNRKGIIILSPFIVMPIIIVSFLLIGQNCLMLHSTSSFLCSQPYIIYDLAFCGWVSSHVATYKSSMDMPTGILIDVLMALTLCSSLWFPGLCFLQVCSGTASL